MNHLKNLGNQMNISIPTDENGYLGRECPEESCEGYFKIKPGTGLPSATDCICPYCGTKKHTSHFHTKDQVEYATSMAFRAITEAVTKDLKKMEFSSKPRGAFGIGISLTVKPGNLPQIYRYQEQALETYIECSECTLNYSVFGVFAYCPDCGLHNSLQTLKKNYEVVLKMLELSTTVEGDLRNHLVENALEDCVSAFDGFGRSLVAAHSKNNGNQNVDIRFQNLEAGLKKVETLLSISLSSVLSHPSFSRVTLSFQKRHLISHKMGVIDNDYIAKSGDQGAILGRKIHISTDEVRSLASDLLSFADVLSSLFSKAGKTP